MMSEETTKIALAALLHDIGKFWQRAGRRGGHAEASAAFVDEFKYLFPNEWLKDLRHGVGNHHNPLGLGIEKIVRVADQLASEGLVEEVDVPQSHRERTSLLPITARVEFREERSKDWLNWGYRLKALRLEDTCIFPTNDVKVSLEDYSCLWEEFKNELKSVTVIKDYFDFVTLLALLRKYTTFIPTVTPSEEDEEYRIFSDVALYDHLKVASAISACLIRLPPNQLDALYRGGLDAENVPVACLLRADFSGIQSFLYRIARAEPTAEFRNTAKRLRGRSIFLSLLADVTADWLTRELGLTPANILFCGGGRFDLLIGTDDATKRNLDEKELNLQKWLVNEFHGELGIQIAVIKLLSKDLNNLEGAFNLLSDELARKKQQKFRKSLGTDEFFVDKWPLLDVCSYCLVTPKRDKAEPWQAGMCPSCYGQRTIGGKLPDTRWLAYLYDSKRGFPLKHEAVVDFAEIFGVKVGFFNEPEMHEVMQGIKHRAEHMVVYRLNNTDFLHDNYSSNVSSGFKFLGHAVPFAQQWMAPNPVKAEKDPIRPNDILDFEEIAFMSSGARLLGVLKADVDYLGQIFGLGVKPKSICRVTSLSSTFDLFFGGWINKICEQVSKKWHRDQSNQNMLKGKVNGLFYNVYSGGDDLLILGPWDAVVELAQEIYNQFREFTCQNENITLSGGILLVKPLFPIQRFAQLSGNQLELSKNFGDYKDHAGLNRKDRITLFGKTVPWKGDKGFVSLLDFGNKLAACVGKDKLPRTFLHFLLRLHDQHFQHKERQNPMWVPKLHYVLARRVTKEVMADEELNLQDNISRLMQYIRIPASYANLKIRRE